MQGTKDQHLLTKFIEEFKLNLTSEITKSVVEVLASTSILQSPSPSSDPYLNTPEVCEIFRFSKSQLHNLRTKHKEFPAHHFGHNVRFKQTEIEQFFKQLNQKQKRDEQ